MSTLYIIATPIGNLQDITLRAIETLKQVDTLAVEDTRQTAKLLNHLGIRKPMIACHARNEKNSAPGIIKLLAQGQSVAYVSDAGTPGISDPGSLLVRQVREEGFQVIPIPGPSAFSSLVSVAGFSGKTVLFEGFLPIKPGKRKKRLQELLDREENFLLYESPFRILKLLQELTDIEPERIMMIGREMTKLHEEFISGKVQEVLIQFQGRPIIKGEFAVLVSGQKIQ